MTREEAIKLIDTHTVCFYNEIDSPTLQALHLAIEALQADDVQGGDAEMQTVAKTPDYMQHSRHDDGRIKVVRCKDCKWWGGNKNTEHNNHICNRALNQDVDYWTRADDFCSYGERKEPHGFTADEWYRDTFGENDGK